MLSAIAGVLPIAEGRIALGGVTLDEVRQGESLVDTFVGFVGGGELAEGAFGWLRGEAGHE